MFVQQLVVVDAIRSSFGELEPHHVEIRHMASTDFSLAFKLQGLPTFSGLEFCQHFYIAASNGERRLFTACTLQGILYSTRYVNTGSKQEVGLVGFNAPRFVTIRALAGLHCLPL